jgi:hypothetical protein
MKEDDHCNSLLYVFCFNLFQLISDIFGFDDWEKNNEKSWPLSSLQLLSVVCSILIERGVATVILIIMCHVV